MKFMKYRIILEKRRMQKKRREAFLRKKRVVQKIWMALIFVFAFLGILALIYPRPRSELAWILYHMIQELRENLFGLRA